MEMVGNVSTSRALRVSKLMLAVMAHLDVHPDKFESALDVFREEPVYAQFASLIASSIGKCIGVGSGRVYRTSIIIFINVWTGHVKRGGAWYRNHGDSYSRV